MVSEVILRSSLKDTGGDTQAKEHRVVQACKNSQSKVERLLV